MRASPLRHGCAVETGSDEREITALSADAPCRHLRLTVTGQVRTGGKRATTAGGRITLTYKVRLPGRVATGTAASTVDHGRWRISLMLAAINFDPLPSRYQITIQYRGDDNHQPAATGRRIRLESERAGLHP